MSEDSQIRKLIESPRVSLLVTLQDYLKNYLDVKMVTPFVREHSSVAGPIKVLGGAYSTPRRGRVKEGRVVNMDVGWLFKEYSSQMSRL